MGVVVGVMQSSGKRARLQVQAACQSHTWQSDPHPTPPIPPATLPAYSELLAIRHCVFLMGPSGCGRSEVIRVLARAISAGCAEPSNPYLQVNNRKKVGQGPGCGCVEGTWRTGFGGLCLEAGAKQAPPSSCYRLPLPPSRMSMPRCPPPACLPACPQVVVRDLNPKSISTQELYGFVNMATREWKDGLLSCTLRELANVPDDNPKWVILDGDLDANWIESMNSLMDDNRLLTLPSNERIRLLPHMKASAGWLGVGGQRCSWGLLLATQAPAAPVPQLLVQQLLDCSPALSPVLRCTALLSLQLIFEIRDLRFATPATATRAGILYISEGQQWRSLVESWLRRVARCARVPGTCSWRRLACCFAHPLDCSPTGFIHHHPPTHPLA